LIMELAEIITQRNARYLFMLLAVSIAVYFVNSLFIFYVDLNLVDYSPTSLKEAVTAQKRTLESRSFQDYRSILERNLFSVKADEAAGGRGSDILARIDRLALTSLNCTLIGTMISEGGESLAVIKDNQSNREEKVAVGDMISGAKVVMILRNKVVLNFNGKDELLVMGIEKIRADKAADEKSAQGDVKGEVLDFKVSKAFVQEAVSNVGKIMTTVRVRPYLKDGKPEGFRISNLQEGSLLKTMGLQNDDIIKSINGQDIRSVEDLMKLYNTLKDSSLFSVAIVRNNQSKILNYKVR